MNQKRSDLFMILLPAAVIVLFSVVSLVQKDRLYSEAERRVLAAFPKISAENVASGRFMTQFEAYSLDQFPLRDELRMAKAVSEYYLFGKKDVNGYYKKEGYISKLEYPLKEERVKRSIENQQRVYDLYIKNTDCKLYQGVIFDKNYYLAPQYGYPVMDYSEYVSMLREGTEYATYIDLSDAISLESFYKTDQHISQEHFLLVAQRLGEAMNNDFTASYETKELAVPFYGAYKHQSALYAAPDKIRYLTNAMLDACEVTSYNTAVPQKSYMYDLNKAYGKDPYELFLSGADAFVTIENPMTESNRELVLFRDSFGSSLAPLLVSGYKKITLVDLRYMNPQILGDYLSFDNQDVLFLYSTLVY